MRLNTQKAIKMKCPAADSQNTNIGEVAQNLRINVACRDYLKGKFLLSTKQV